LQVLRRVIVIVEIDDARAIHGEILFDANRSSYRGPSGPRIFWRHLYLARVGPHPHALFTLRSLAGSLACGVSCDVATRANTLATLPAQSPARSRCPWARR